MGRLFSFNRRRKKISKPRKQVGRIAAINKIDNTADEIQFVRNSPTYEGKYLVVKDSKHIIASQDPTPLFWVCDLTDSALLGLINRLPTSPDNFTNLADAVAWSKENGFLITSQGDIDSSVNDGLVYEIDFSKILSYPKGGNKVFNTIGDSGDVTNHALSQWVAMGGGTAYYAAPYSGTYIYELDQNGNQTTRISNVGPTNGTFSVTAGRRYYSNKPIHFHDPGDNHLFVPISLKGTQFGHYSSRYNGSTYKIYAPVGATIKQFNGSNPQSATPNATLSLGRHELGTMTHASDGVNVFFVSDRPVIMSVYEDGGGDKSILPPADNLVYQRRNAGERMMNNSAPDKTNAGHVLSGSYACWSIAIADGSGGDMTTHISANHITENYTWGQTVSDYQIVAPYPDTEIVVSSWNGSSWTAHETQSLDGTELSPAMSFRSGNGGFGVQDSIGNDSGGANNFNGNTLWKWEGNNPFAIWINDTSNDEEKLLGWNNGWEGDEGILYNSPSFDSDGYISLDGSNDYIQATLQGINLDSACTIEGWMKRKTTPSNWRTFFNIKPEGANTPFFEFRSGANQQHIYADYYSGTDYYTPSAAFTTGEWGHAIATYDGSGNIRMYFNGELVGTKTGVPSFTLGDDPVLTIGRAYSNDRYTDIEVKSVRIYNKALSATEVSQNYHKGKNTTANLEIYYDADNIVSTQDESAWHDISGNGRDATKTGSPTLTTLGGAKCWNFTSTNQYFDYNNSFSNLTACTLEAWIYPAASEVSSGDRGTIIQGNIYMSWNKSNRRLSSYWYSTSNRGYHEPSLQMDREEWYHLCTVWNGTQLLQYINGNLEKTTSTTLYTSGTNGYINRVRVGMESSGRQFAGGIATVKVYSGALTQEEVFDNYNSYKGRFGK